MERNIFTKFINVWLNSPFIAVIASLTASEKTHPLVDLIAASHNIADLPSKNMPTAMMSGNQSFRS